MDKNLSICILLEIQQFKKYYKTFVYLGVSSNGKNETLRHNLIEIY